MSDETIEEWAARATPTLTTEGWEAANALMVPWASGARGLATLLGMMVDTGAPEAPPRHLLVAIQAFRDKIAAGLELDDARAILAARAGQHQYAANQQDRAVRLGLLTADGKLTDFGREIATKLPEVSHG